MKHLNIYKNENFNYKSLTSYKNESFNMKPLATYITEYIINKKLDTPINSEDKYHPQTKEELIENIKECFNNEDYNLNCIDTSKITDMSYVFKLIPEAHNINFDISDWDVSNVEYMEHMFDECVKFNCDLSKWNVSNVENMYYMLYNCKSITNKPSWYKDKE